MTKFQVAYVPVGVPTFHLESAQKEFEKSIDLLNTITDAAIVPDKMLLSIQDLTNSLDTIEPSLIILQNITFANANFMRVRFLKDFRVRYCFGHFVSRL